MIDTHSDEPDDRETIVVRVRADQGGSANGAADGAVNGIALESDTTVVRAPRRGAVAAPAVVGAVDVDDVDATIAQSQSQSQSQRPAPGQASSLAASLPWVYGPRVDEAHGAEPAVGSGSESQSLRAAQPHRPADEAQPPVDTREQLPSFARRTRRARAATLASYVVVVCVSVAGLWAVGVLAFAG